MPRSKKINFKIKHLALNPYVLRLYFLQALNAEFGFSNGIKADLGKFNGSLKELTEKKIKSILRNNSCWNFYPRPKFYVFTKKDSDLNLKNLESIFDTSLDQITRESIASFPTLFTDIKEVSFDQKGLLVLERFSNQFYYLFSADGKMIVDDSHDLDLLPDGKFLCRKFNCRFVIRKYSSRRRSLNRPRLTSENENFFFIKGRDRIKLIANSSKLKRIENFKPPKNREEVLKILENPKTNYITSPDLSDFYEIDKELALIAVSRDILAYSLLDESLQNDPDILTLVFKKDESWIEAVISEYKIDPNSYIKNRLHRKRFTYEVRV